MRAVKDTPCLAAFYAWRKQQPCFITGHYGVDLAHISLPLRRGLPNAARVERLLDRTHRSHHGAEGYYCIPLKPEYHRQQSPYPYSLHKLGEAQFFEHHGISEAEVFAELAQAIAAFFLEVHHG